MITLKKQYINNYYTLPGFDVSVDEWKKMLQNPSIFDENSLNMVKIWYYETNHAASSKRMTEKYRPGLSNSPYNGVVVGLGKRVLNYLNRYEIEPEDGSSTYWVTIFNGWVDEGLFIWKLRDDIVTALEELHIECNEIFARKDADDIEQLTKVKRELVKKDFELDKNSETKTNNSKNKTGYIDFEYLQKRKSKIGEYGEQLVLEYETRQLLSYGIAQKPKHISAIDSSAGYDILSYDENGKIKRIEVKTKKAKSDSRLDFYISANEREKFETLEGYVLYFVSNLNSVRPTLRIVTKEIYDQLEFVAITYHVKANIKPIN